MHNVISHCSFTCFHESSLQAAIQTPKAHCKKQVFFKKCKCKKQSFFKNVIIFISLVLKIMEKNAKNVKNMPITTKIATFRLSEDDNLVCRKALEPFLLIKSRTGTRILYFQNQESIIYFQRTQNSIQHIHRNYLCFATP